MCQYAAHRSEAHFAEPLSFTPERYLDDHVDNKHKYDGDVKQAVQPFSMGPRNCIGQNLARSEMRLILAKLIWHFDMALSDEGTTWLTQQKAYGLWDKDPLLVRMTGRA